MAVLPDNDRADVWADFMRKISDARESCAVNKTDLRAAVDALDSFLETNAAAINGAIPRANLTAAQKARILAYVALKRWGG